MHQAHSAMQLYLGDYDDHFTPVNYEPGQAPDPKYDRTWVQLLLPYARSISIFTCPADYGARPKAEGTFDEDLPPSDTYARFYSESLRSDMGFNYIYLSPVVQQGDRWVSAPRSATDVADPAKTIMFVDSVWGRDQGGVPLGGGSWLVLPPCRFALSGSSTIDTFRINGNFYAPSLGWSGTTTSQFVYGGSWPWHSGRMNVTRVDGSIRSVTPDELGAGCNVQPSWDGYISDPSSYMWALGE
jgi:prepilin-type processing-associated H-X9-DG protein